MFVDERKSDIKAEAFLACTLKFSVLFMLIINLE